MPALNDKQQNRTAVPMRILVADDVEMNVNLAKWYFEENQHNVFSAENGLEAITLAKEENPQAVLMDVNMPSLDGIEATRQLRQLNYCGLIYGVTAHVDPETKSRCYQAGMDGVIEKPVDYPELIKFLAEDVARQSDALDNSIVYEHFSNLGLEPAAQLYDKALQELQKNMSEDEGVAVEQLVSKEQLHKLKGLAGNFGLRAMLDLFESFADDGGILSPATYALWMKTMRITQSAINQYQPNKM